MSTIVVVRKGRQACIAADSLTTYGDITLHASYERHHDKIIQHGDNHIGIVGSAAHEMVLRMALRDLPDADFSNRENVFSTFVKLHPLLKEHYFLNPKETEEDAYESSRIDALILNRHGIFGIYSLREVFAYNRFWAIGSGAEFALGAMHAVYDHLPNAEAIARTGVEAGAAFNNATALPLTLYSMTLDSEPETLLV
jgi:ATP-dependent protease HslVU (ClpYQ) peptidase subunit